jgi:hypothetical protein
MESDNQYEDLTTDAIERRKAFREEKLRRGGIEQVIQEEKDRAWRVWFNDQGEIVCFGQHDPEDRPDTWKTYEFTEEQIGRLRELDDHDLSKFRVLPDPKNSERMMLDLKPLETVYLSKDRDFLSEIKPAADPSKPEQAQVTVSLHGNSLTVSLAKDVKETLYSEVFPVSATINGQRLLKFYVTAPGDPHIMYAYKTVALADLITQDSVTVKLDADLTGYGLYTIQQFDKYLRT